MTSYLFAAIRNLGGSRLAPGGLPDTRSRTLAIRIVRWEVIRETELMSTSVADQIA